MKGFFPVLFVVFAIVVSGRAQTLQDFSSVFDGNTFFYGSWEVAGSTEGSTAPFTGITNVGGVLSITGTTPTNSSTSGVEFFFPSYAGIGSNTLLSVTAQTLPGNASTSFQITLVDSGANLAFATFATSDFPNGSYTTLSSSLTMQSGFNSGEIDSFRISGAQVGGTATFNVSFDHISAIPEPSTYAAILGLAAMGVVAWKRRRRRA